MFYLFYRHLIIYFNKETLEAYGSLLEALVSVSEVVRIKGSFTFEPAYTIEQIVETMSAATGLKAPKLVINGKLLMIAASIIGAIGGRKLGIHPDRVKKLMISTNISGKKLSESGYNYKYTLKSAIEDWYKDNDYQFLK